MRKRVEMSKNFSLGANHGHASWYSSSKTIKLAYFKLLTFSKTQHPPRAQRPDHAPLRWAKYHHPFSPPSQYAEAEVTPLPFNHIINYARSIPYMLQVT
jgi:hypothetical protein